MIAAFDVHYLPEGRASVAAVMFLHYSDAVPCATYRAPAQIVSPYIPGQFYRRELPCILALLERIREVPEEMIVDGYVMLGDRPGLGRHLFDHLGGRVPVIGVAKSGYRGSTGVEVLRGRSRRPLYVTSAGQSPTAAAQKIASMHGPYRIPTLLKCADQLARRV